MPAVQVERSIQIEAPHIHVLAAINNFNEWPKWSPWLCMEPSATVRVRGDPGEPGHGYDWQGELVGAGDMQLTDINGGDLKMDLNFVKPFKSQAKVAMQAHAVNEQLSQVTWQMNSKLPFFMFFMAGMMKRMIGADYERGLKMLKEYVETGRVNSSVEVVGIVDVGHQHYVGVGEHSSMKQIGESMARTMPAAARLAQDNGLTVDGAPGALYKHVNFKSMECDYVSIMPVSEPASVSEGESGKIEGGRAIKVIHRGSYQHLPNAWMAAFAYLRNNKLKHRGNGDYEWYLNDPADTAEADLITEVVVPIR